MGRTTPRPIDDLDRGEALLQRTGSFWSSVFPDNDKFRVILEGLAHLRAQYEVDRAEAKELVGRHTAPWSHQTLHLPLRLLRSQAKETGVVYGPNLAFFGPQPAGQTYPEGLTLKFGEPPGFGPTSMPLTANVLDLPWCITNLVRSPTRTWVNGVDYWVDRGSRRLNFRDDPFADPKVAWRPVTSPDGSEDQEILLWAWRAETDRRYLQDYWAYAFDLDLTSTEASRNLLNAYADGLVGGLSRDRLTEFLAAVADTPLTGSDEVLLASIDEGDSRLILTDKAAYRVPREASASASVGETIRRGRPVTDAVTVSEVCGSNPDWSLLNGISVPPELLGAGYRGALSFVNQDLPSIVVYPGEHGRTELRVATGGFADDVEKFWSEVHRRGIAAGATFAELLDTRSNPTGQPTAANLPAVLNPMLFVAGYFLADNMTTARLRTGSFGPDGPGIHNIRRMTDVIPAHVFLALQTELDPEEETFDLEESGGDDGVNTGPCIPAPADAAYGDGGSHPGTLVFTELMPSMNSVGGSCQT